MDIKKVVYIFSIVAGLARFLRVGCSFGPFLQNKFMVEVLYICTDLSIILGLVGIYFGQINDLGKIGFIGFVITLLGFSFIAGPETTFAGMSVYAIGTPIIGVGLTCFSLSQLRSNTINTFIPLLMLSSIVIGGIGILLPRLPEIFFISGILLGVSFSLNGWYVYKHI